MEEESIKMKHLRIKPSKIMRVGGYDVDVTKPASRIQVGNNLFIKHYDRQFPGVAIRVKGQPEIILNEHMAGDLALLLKRYSNPKIYTAIEVAWIQNRFKFNPEVVEFVQRILDKEVTLNEMNKIRELNEEKEKVAERLTDRKRLGSLFG